MLRMLGKGVEEHPVVPGQLRMWFAPGEQFIFILSLDEGGRCTVQNMSAGWADSFKVDFVKNASILVSDPK